MTKGKNRQWRLSARPVGLVKESDFEFIEEPVPTPGHGEILIRNVYLSLDPGYRGWMKDRKSYITPVQIGDVMRGLTIGVVEQSRSDEFQVGDLVQGMSGWQEFAVSDGKSLTKLPRNLTTPLTAYFGLLGHIGITAYFGLLDVGRPKAGETLVVSAGAGAVGSIVGQIGRIVGCYVVGIAGTDEKCAWMKESLGFDAVINYKTEPFLKALTERCPNGIDIYFDNVAGEMLDWVLSLINIKARIVYCGNISQSNNDELAPGPYNLRNILTQRARYEGFVVFDYMDRAQEAIEALGAWLADGKIQYRVDVVDGLESAPRAFNKLFDGSNVGKLVVKISDEPAR